MTNTKLKYQSFTGITNTFFHEINATIKDNTIEVSSNGKKAILKIVIKPVTYTNRDYIYQLKKTQLNLLKDKGIKFLIDGQNIDDVFFNLCRNLMLSILK